MREKESATRIIFVRHAQPDFPSDRIYCDGDEDPDLTEEGRIQAVELGECLKDVSIDAAYASPLLRTTLTAKEIVRWHNLDVSYDSRLKERHFGIWEGLYFNEISEGWPEQFVEWKKDQAGYAPEGGESAYDLLARVGEVVECIKEKHRGETVLVVCHVGPIRVLTAAALGLSVDRFRSLRIDPASVTCIDYGASQNNLVLLNGLVGRRLISVL